MSFSRKGLAKEKGYMYVRKRNNDKSHEKERRKSVIQREEMYLLMSIQLQGVWQSSFCLTEHILYCIVHHYNYNTFARFIYREYTRVGHRVLLRSECIILLRSFKEHTILLRSFFEFWRLMRPKRTMRSFTFFS